MNKENISENITTSSTEKSTTSSSKYSQQHHHVESSSPLEDLKTLSLQEVKKRGSCKDCQSILNPPCRTTIPMDCIGQFKGIENFPAGSQVVFRDMSSLTHVFSVTMAIRLNIFEVIQMYNSNTFMCLKEIRSLIKGTNMTERSLRDLLMVLVAQGFLDVSGEIGSEKFRNTELTNSSFLSSSPTNSIRSYLNIEKFMRIFGDYSKSGFVHPNLLNHSNYSYSNEEDAESDLDYFYKSSEGFISRFIDTFDFSRFSKITDIRGGNGRYAMEIKGRYPSSEVRAFDKPSLEKIALRNIERCSKTSSDSRGKSNNTSSVPCSSTMPSSNPYTITSSQMTSSNTNTGSGICTRTMSSDVRFISGSLVSDTLPESDCVFAPYIFMHFNSESMRSVLKNVVSSLRPNGQLVIVERLLHGDRYDSVTYAMSFMMQVLNCEGFARTFEEFRSMLLEAGFKSVERRDMGESMMDVIVCTR
jgi:hypothetical protein